MTAIAIIILVVVLFASLIRDDHEKSAELKARLDRARKKKEDRQ